MTEYDSGGWMIPASKPIDAPAAKQPIDGLTPAQLEQAAAFIAERLRDTGPISPTWMLAHDLAEAISKKPIEITVDGEPDAPGRLPGHARGVDDAVQAAAFMDLISKDEYWEPGDRGPGFWMPNKLSAREVREGIATVRRAIAAEAHALVLRFGGEYHADSPGAMADDVAGRIERGVTDGV